VRQLANLQLSTHRRSHAFPIGHLGKQIPVGRAVLIPGDLAGAVGEHVTERLVDFSTGFEGGLGRHGLVGRMEGWKMGS
jgi:hypothetical protein